MSFSEDHRSLRSMLGHWQNHNSSLSAALLHDLSQQRARAQEDGQIELSQGDHDDGMDRVFLATFGPFSSWNGHDRHRLLSSAEAENDPRTLLHNDLLSSSLPFPTTATTMGGEEVIHNAMTSCETSSQHNSRQATRNRMANILDAALELIREDDEDNHHHQVAPEPIGLNHL